MVEYHALAGLVRGIQHFQARIDPPTPKSVNDILPAAWREAVAERLASTQMQQVESWLGYQATTEIDQLLSVFSRLGEQSQNSSDRYLPLKPLDIDENIIFPQEKQAQSAMQQAYQYLWDNLYAEMKAIQTEEDEHTYIVSLQSIIQRYLWCIPAFDDDISLYEYSRVLSALLASSAHLQESDLGEVPVMRLLEGDISGIQRFIYTIKAKGAAKGLRARSFYLQALTQATAQLILRETRMPGTNLLYAGGGRFLFNKVAILNRKSLI